MLLGATYAQISIPTLITNAVITIQTVLFSSDGIDDPANPYKVRVFSDSSNAATLVVEWGLKVNDLIAPSTSTTYLVTTDDTGILQFEDINNIGGGWVGWGSVSGKWLSSIAVISGIYYPSQVGIGTDADIDYKLSIFDEKSALLINKWDIKINELGAWVLANGTGVLTVDTNGIVGMTKVTSDMLDASIDAGVWDVAWWWSISYISWNVGIKTVAPFTDFHVDGDILTDRLYVWNGETTITNNGINAYWFSNNDIIIGSRTNNVAIGGIAPTQKLHVDGKVLIDSTQADDAGLIFEDLAYTSPPTTGINNVDCNVLSVDASGNVILVDADDACNAPAGGGLTRQDICADCRWGATMIELQYLWSTTVTVTVRDGIQTYFSNTVDPNEKIIVYGTNSDGWFQETSTVIEVNGSLHDSYDNTCSDPLNPGTTLGDFVITRARSKHAWFICPL